MMKKYFSALLVVFVVAVAGTIGATPSKTGAAPVPDSAAAAAKAEPALSGKVVETMNAGGYTYVCIEKKGKKTWAAVPEMKVTVGQQISLQPGQEMKGFASKSLNRTFDSIVFSGGPASGAPSAASAAPASAEPGHGGSKAAAAQTAEKISVEKAAGADAYTVAEIYGNKTKLNKKTAVVKAKVVKVSPEIMGKNWIHLRDGSGAADKGTNNLVVTSQDLPKVGDVVTMKGTIYKDKDFGAGYKYTVIMEEASIKK